MSRPSGQITDLEPLERQEYLLILSHLAAHWRLFYELLWETGIREGEALAIERKDLQDGGVWVTRTKRKDHLLEHLPLSRGLYSRLRILSLQHKDTHVFPFTASAAWLALKKACATAGVRKTIHPHLFRHGFGHRAVKANLAPGNAMDQAAVIQKMMGHKDIKSTLRYIKATKAEVKDAFQKLNPF